MFKSLKQPTTLFVILFVLVLAAGAVGLRKHRTSQVEALKKIQSIPWALQTVVVEQGDLSQEFQALATLNANTEITISSQIAGEIISMGPREGVEVKQGDILAQISVNELIEQRAGLKDQLQAAEATLRQAKDEFARQQGLIKKHLTSQELFESKKTAALAAQKQVSNLQRQIAAQNIRIGYGTIYAPADALIASRFSEAGDMAMPGKRLYALSVDSASRLQVKLPQQVLEQVHPGTRVLLDYGSQQQEIQLTRIFPALDSHALGTAEADLSNMPFGLPSGSRILAKVILKSVENVLIVPHQAIVETAPSPATEKGNNKLIEGFVFKVVAGNSPDEYKKLQRLDVSIELNAHKALAISNDEVQAGDQLILAHESVLLQLHDGDPVIVEPMETVNSELRQ